jgi:hypothetical protein
VIRSLLDAWPTRRRVAAAILLPAVTAWFVVVGGSTGAPLPAGWYALAIVAGALGAGVLASYVPVTGFKPDLGCTPCATVSALTVVAASVVLRNYGADVAGPLVASAVLLFGLAQRLREPATCATGVGA